MDDRNAFSNFAAAFMRVMDECQLDGRRDGNASRRQKTGGDDNPSCADFVEPVEIKTAVRVDNPADISVDDAHEGDHSQPGKSNAFPLEELETIRSEGNRLFSEQDWAGAVSKYSQCIDKAVSKMKKKKRIKREIDKEKFNHILILAYSNRAEARLRLQAYQDAMIDADKALELDPKHVKSLVRKGKAAHGLGLFEKSCIVFKAALEQSPQDQSILRNLEASSTAYEQSQTGPLPRPPKSTLGNVNPSCADFVGPVEIRRVSYGCGRRGLFATQRVVAGEILLVDNPLANVRQKLNANHFNLHIQLKESIQRISKAPNIFSGVQEDLVIELANRVMNSKRQMAQLYSLAVHGKQKMEIPSMELFRPGSYWVPDDADKLQVDIGLIFDIVKLNAFGSFKKENDDRTMGEASCCIQLLPSFANHSCAPSCLIDCIDDTMFIRAARDIAEGEELTISYLDNLYETVDARQAKTKNWFFECICERCLYEKTLEPQLSKIRKALPRLKEAAKAESCPGPKRWRALEKIAALADEVEVVIFKLESKQQGWIRASFLEAFGTKLKLAVENHDVESSILLTKKIADTFASVLLPSDCRPYSSNWGT